MKHLPSVKRPHTVPVTKRGKEVQGQVREHRIGPVHQDALQMAALTEGNAGQDQDVHGKVGLVVSWGHSL